MTDYGGMLFSAPRPARPKRSEPGGFDYGSELFGTPQPAAPAPPPAAQPREVSPLSAAIQGFSDFAAFDYADEAEAALRSKVGDEDYESALADVRERQEASPSLPYYAGAAGALLTPGGIASATVKGAKALSPLAARVFGQKAAPYAAGAGVGAVEGAVAATGGAEGGVEERLQAAPTGAALGAAGGVAGEAIGQGLTRFSQRRQARDIERLDPRQAAELQRLAREQGIQLTPAETTGLPSLAQQQKLLGNTPGAGDDLGDFYRRRADEQIEPAVGRFLDEVGDFAGDETAGELTRAAATRAMDDVAANRAAQASPIYQKAFAAGRPVDTSDVFKQLKSAKSRFPEGGEVRRTLGRAERLLQRQVEKADGTPAYIAETDMQRLHGAKVEIDQMLEGANLSKRLGATTRAQLQGVKTSLLEALDQASPDYASARAIYADLSPGVQRVREGAAGKIAELPDAQLRTVASRLFDKNKISPRSAAEARTLLQNTDPDAWQSIKRSFLEDAWLRAGQETLGSQGAPVNRGAKFRKQLLGDPRQLAVLQKVLEPAEMRGLNELSRVLEASGRVKPIGSDTAWNQEALKVMRRDSRGVLSRVLGGINPNVLKDVSEYMDQRGFEKEAGRLVDVITSPDGLEMLQELKRLSPNQEFRRALIGYAAGLGAAREAEIETPAAAPEPTAAASPPVPEPRPDPRLDEMQAQMDEMAKTQAVAENRAKEFATLARDQQAFMGEQLGVLSETQQLLAEAPTSPDGQWTRQGADVVERDDQGRAAVVEVTEASEDGKTRVRRMRVKRDGFGRFTGLEKR